MLNFLQDLQRTRKPVPTAIPESSPSHLGHRSGTSILFSDIINSVQFIRQGAAGRKIGSIMPIHAPLVLLFFIKSAVMSSLFTGVSPCDRGYNMIRTPLLFTRIAGLLSNINSTISFFSLKPHRNASELFSGRIQCVYKWEIA
jgi:hypothetical protein